MAMGQRLMGLRRKIVKMRTGYENFMERQGFYVVLALCVMTIIGTAVYTNKNEKAIVTPPPNQGLMAAAEDDRVERLKDAKTPSPVPTEPVPSFTFPLSSPGAVFRAFDGARPAYFESSDHWQLHKAVDIKADYGQSVLAVAEGTVSDIREGSTDAVLIALSHSGGYESRYKGLLNAAALRVGDTVKAGQVIGNAGYGPLLEQADGAHVHLEILHNGIPVNPSDLFN